MKVQHLCIFLLAISLSACSGLSPRKSITQGIDYTGKNGVYYEYTSTFVPPAEEPAPVLEAPSVDEEEKPLGEDEDFTSENLAESYSNYGDLVITVAKRKFKLGEDANRAQMALFMKALEAGYVQSRRTYQPKGFTYNVAYVGSVNPLSDVEVSCRMGEHSANNIGQHACNLFFTTTRTQYVQLVKESQDATHL